RTAGRCGRTGNVRWNEAPLEIPEPVLGFRAGNLHTRHPRREDTGYRPVHDPAVPHDVRHSPTAVPHASGYPSRHRLRTGTDDLLRVAVRPSAGRRRRALVRALRHRGTERRAPAPAEGPIIVSNALAQEFDYRGADVLYFYNSFGPPTLDAVLARIEECIR